MAVLEHRNSRCAGIFGSRVDRVPEFLPNRASTPAQWNTVCVTHSVGETATPNRIQLAIGAWAHADRECVLATPMLCWPSSSTRLIRNPEGHAPTTGTPPNNAGSPRSVTNGSVSPFFSPPDTRHMTWPEVPEARKVANGSPDSYPRLDLTATCCSADVTVLSKNTTIAIAPRSPPHRASSGPSSSLPAIRAAVEMWRRIR